MTFTRWRIRTVPPLATPVDVYLVVDTTAPRVVNAIERALAWQAITVERVDESSRYVDRVAIVDASSGAAIDVTDRRD